MNAYWAAGLILLGTFISSVAQVVLKKAAMKTYASKLKEYLNPPVIIAYAVFVGTTVFGVFAYKYIPLSLGPVLEASAYFYITFFGVTIFHEKLNKTKILALIFIISGIMIYSLGGSV